MEDLDKIDKYSMYADILANQSKLKEQLNEKVARLKKVNTAYQNYLQANPHKEERKKLQKKVDILREQLMKFHHPWI